MGEVRNGVIEGRGSIKYHSGDLYEGEFALNQKHGNGKYTCCDGTVYQGQWDQDQPKGKGRINYVNGNWF